jgi:hypothetical protein
MIMVCDPVCWSLEHVPVNAGIVEMIRLAFPAEEIVFVGEASHLHQVRAQLSSEVSLSISWKAVAISPRYASFFVRSRHDLKLLRHLLKMGRKDPDSLLLLAACAPATLMALKLLLYCSTSRGKKVQIVLHGCLDALKGWRSRNPVLRMQDMKAALTFGSNRDLQYIVLEEPIRNAVGQILPSLEPHMGVLDHPIPTNEEPQGEIEFRRPLKFGFLGMASEAKGFRLFQEGASTVTAKYPGLVEFHAVGWMDKQSNMATDSLITKPGTWLMSRVDYIRQLHTLHFVCLLYEGPHYQLSPSGVLLDAIAWEKPIIASPLPIVENLVSRFGDIGYLCAGQKQLCEIIGQIIEREDVDHYRKQVASMRKVRLSRTPKYLAPTYRHLRAQFVSQGDAQMNPGKVSHREDTGAA